MVLSLLHPTLCRSSVTENGGPLCPSCTVLNPPHRALSALCVNHYQLLSMLVYFLLPSVDMLIAFLVFMKDSIQILYSWHILQWESWGLNDLFKCRWRLYSAPACSALVTFHLALLCTHFQLLCILSGNFTFHCLDWYGNQNPIWEDKPNKNDNGEIESKLQ